MTNLSIFPGTQPNQMDSDSLLGFDPLPATHVIDDWGRFFPESAPGADIGINDRVAAGDSPNPDPIILQYAYKLDPTIVDPLAVLPLIVPEPTALQEAEAAVSPAQLPTYVTIPKSQPQPMPSLALLNLLRGNSYGLPSGQNVADALIAAGKPVQKLNPEHVVVRVATNDKSTPQNFQWTAPPSGFATKTPLWFYILAEAQAKIVQNIPIDADGLFSETLLLNGPGALSQLGWVGGRIVAEVFYGLLDEDHESVFNHPGAKGFVPRFAKDGSLLCMRNLLEYGLGAKAKVERVLEPA